MLPGAFSKVTQKWLRIKNPLRETFDYLDAFTSKYLCRYSRKCKVLTMNRAETLRTLPAGADLAGAPRRLRVPVAAAEVHDLGGAGERPEKTREYS